MRRMAFIAASLALLLTSAGRNDPSGDIKSSSAGGNASIVSPLDMGASGQISFGPDATGAANANQRICIGTVNPVSDSAAGGYNGIAIGSGASINVGSDTSADRNVCIGAACSVSVDSANHAYRNVAIGALATTAGYRNVALGNGAACYGQVDAAIGNFATVGGPLSAQQVTQSLAIGNGATNPNNFSTALGAGATVFSDHQIMLGTSAETVVTPGALTLNGNATIPAASFIQYGSGTKLYGSNYTNDATGATLTVADGDGTTNLGRLRLGLPTSASALITGFGGDIYLQPATAGRVLLYSPGSANAPALIFNGDLTTGWYAPLKGQTAFTNAGAQTLLLDGSKNATFFGPVKVPNGTAAAPSFSLGSVAQTNTVSVNTVTASHVYAVTINGTAYSYTATGADTQQSILTALNSAIGVTTVSGVVTGTGGSALLTLTAITSGTAVTYTAVDSLLTQAQTVANVAPGGWFYDSTNASIAASVNGVEAFQVSAPSGTPTIQIGSNAAGVSLSNTGTALLAMSGNFTITGAMNVASINATYPTYRLGGNSLSGMGSTSASNLLLFTNGAQALALDANQNATFNGPTVNIPSTSAALNIGPATTSGVQLQYSPGILQVNNGVGSGLASMYGSKFIASNFVGNAGAASGPTNCAYGVNNAGGSQVGMYFPSTDKTSVGLATNGVSALVIDSTQNATFSATVKVQSAGTIRSGSASTPNSVVTGNIGDMYLSTAGGAATTLWIKESGAATNTGWVGK
jgi:hypothetical protein